MILNDSTTGELWAEERPGGGAIHIGTFHLDTNMFQEAPEDGIQMDSFKIPTTPGIKITIKGRFHFTTDHFEEFRRKWLRKKFPALHWN